MKPTYPMHISGARIKRQTATRIAWLVTVFLIVGCASGGNSDVGSYFMTPGLNDTRAQAIVVGMTPAQVEAAIGKPHQRVRFGNLNATAWDYRYTDTWGYITEFAVMIGDNGRVVGTVSARALADDR